MLMQVMVVIIDFIEITIVKLLIVSNSNSPVSVAP